MLSQEELEIGNNPEENNNEEVRIGAYFKGTESNISKEFFDFNLFLSFLSLVLSLSLSFVNL